MYLLDYLTFLDNYINLMFILQILCDILGRFLESRRLLEHRTSEQF